MALTECETWEETNNVELTVEECLKVIAATSLEVNDDEGNVDPTLLTDDEFAQWIRYGTHNQAYCWLKYSEAYDYDSVNDWGNDPFQAGDFYSFLMPNTRKYEHFFNDPDCNQIFRMGRGREQPDAITFGDVGAHDHNTLIMTNRIQITPWVTHDQMVIQMFG